MRDAETAEQGSSCSSRRENFAICLSYAQLFALSHLVEGSALCVSQYSLVVVLHLDLGVRENQSETACFILPGAEKANQLAYSDLLQGPVPRDTAGKPKNGEFSCQATRNGDCKSALTFRVLGNPKTAQSCKARVCKTTLSLVQLKALQMSDHSMFSTNC